MDLKALVSSVKTCYDLESLTKLETGFTMSSKEISDLTGVRHDNAKRTLEALVESKIIVQPQVEDEQFLDAMGRQRTERVFYLDERSAIVLAARLSPEFTAKVVDQWLEMRALISQQQQEIIKLREAELKRLGTDLARVENKAKSAKVLAAMVNKTLVKQYRTSPELQEAAIAVLEAEVDYIHSERNFRFLYDNTAAELHMTQDKLRELDRYTKTCCKVKPDFAHWPYPNLLEVLGYRRPRVANL